ncbi:uncharacterized protein Z520_10128 [Fonsecaea multimorphosa CBS 102226]|uniref:SWIRM domain-containing protein n=1 Tax=Fonsecaea multimorphosa CBS 102226 TaxID=1442371 RepID=A0A0D2JLD0_9EURO|nr:uncharacterized protein Z520_10128 [Fonsecaea multimorphosa CBS 102226]KIX94102.1 hypothetical protein Z520_10128 [Fonsecaea multimorphosa CBS 102226]OAL19455.1 hypothetical protein AYO22_09617 [Fonsecaea multimorphosa]
MASEPLLPSKEAPSLPPTSKTNMAALNKNALITPPDPPEHDFGAIAAHEDKSDDPLLAEVLPPTPGLSRRSSQSSSSPAQALFPSEPVSSQQATAQPSNYSASDYARAIPLHTFEYDQILRMGARRFLATIKPDYIFFLKDKPLPEEHRLVPAHELARRLERFYEYRIDWAQPALGADSVRYYTSCSPGPWNGLKRLAFAGLLKKYAPDDMDSVYLDIRKYLYNGKPSPMEHIPEGCSLSRAPSYSVQAKAGRKSKPAKTSERPPSRPVAVALSQEKKADMPDAASNLGQEPLSGTKGVKRRYVEEQTEEEPRTVDVKGVSDTEPDELESVKSVKKQKVVSDSKPKPTRRVSDNKSKNIRNRNSDKPRGPSESLCRNIKDTLNKRSQDKNNFEAFKDAIMPENGPEISLSPCDFTAEELKDIRELQDIGDCTGLHPEEIKLCKLLAMTSDLYKCQKARCFIGLALFVEYNLEKLGENNPKFKALNVGKAQFQLFGNVDVNKLSKVYTTFKKWGWVEDMTQQSIPQSYLDRFPQTHRLALRNEVAEYEATIPAEKRIFRV